MDIAASVSGETSGMPPASPSPDDSHSAIGDLLIASFSELPLCKSRFLLFNGIFPFHRAYVY